MKTDETAVDMEAVEADMAEALRDPEPTLADVNMSVNNMQVAMERMANLFADMIELVGEISTGVTELSEHDGEVQRSLKQRVQILEQLTAEVETRVFRKCVDGCGRHGFMGTRYTRFGNVTRDDFGDIPGGGEHCPCCGTKLTEVSGPEWLAVKNGGAA